MSSRGSASAQHFQSDFLLFTEQNYKSLFFYTFLNNFAKKVTFQREDNSYKKFKTVNAL